MRNLGLCICVTFWALCAGEDKRATSSSFAVLQGKKNDANYMPNDYVDQKTRYGFAEIADERPYANWAPVDPLGLYKRLPSGFFGLRGKKDLGAGLDLLDDFEDPMAKRPSPSGFWGMRGKREYDVSPYDAKRAPESRFFGMRGKRQPNKNSFFGMRGKKYDVRGKFVGVRGKKSFESGNPEYFDDDDMSLDQLMYFLSQNGRN